MNRTHLVAFALGGLLLGFLTAAAPSSKEESLGEKVVAYCQQNKGEMVGNGECSSLAGHALKAAGAKGRGPDRPDKGDYTWGEQIFHLEAGTPAAPAAPKAQGKPTDIKPGDIIQFREAKFEGKRPKGGHYSMSMHHHTAVVEAVEEGGEIVKILHQNHNGVKTVGQATLHLNDLKEGWLRFYRPVPDGKSK